MLIYLLVTFVQQSQAFIYQIQTLMHELTHGMPEADGYKTKIEQFMTNWLEAKGQIKKTPCGLAWIREWGPLRYAGRSEF